MHIICCQSRLPRGLTALIRGLRRHTVYAMCETRGKAQQNHNDNKGYEKTNVPRHVTIIC